MSPYGLLAPIHIRSCPLIHSSFFKHWGKVISPKPSALLGLSVAFYQPALGTLAVPFSLVHFHSLLHWFFPLVYDHQLIYPKLSFLWILLPFKLFLCISPVITPFERCFYYIYFLSFLAKH
jgi:hypothetical protein